MTVQDVILFGPIQQLLIEHLAVNMPLYGYSMPVGPELPNPRTSESIVLTRAGGSELNEVTDSPMFLLEVRAGKYIRAEQIILTTMAVIRALEGNMLGGKYQVDDVRAAGDPVNLPDPDTDSHIRFTQLIQLDVRGEVLAVL